MSVMLGLWVGLAVIIIGFLWVSVEWWRAARDLDDMWGHYMEMEEWANRVEGKWKRATGHCHRMALERKETDRLHKRRMRSLMDESARWEAMGRFVPTDDIREQVRTEMMRNPGRKVEFATIPGRRSWSVDNDPMVARFANIQCRVEKVCIRRSWDPCIPPLIAYVAIMVHNDQPLCAVGDPGFARIVNQACLGAATIEDVVENVNAHLGVPHADRTH